MTIDQVNMVSLARAARAVDCDSRTLLRAIRRAISEGRITEDCLIRFGPRSTRVDLEKVMELFKCGDGKVG